MTQPGDGVASAGAVALDVEPDAEGFYPRLRAQVLPGADQVGREIGRRIAGPIVSEIARGISEGVRDGGRGMTAQGTRIGNDLGAAIGRALKARVEAAVRSLPDARLDADTTALDRKIAASQAKMTALTNARVRVDVDTGQSEAQLAAIEASAARISGLAPSIRVEADTGAAEAALASVAAAAQALSADTIKIKVSVSTGTGAARLDAIRAAAAALSSVTIEITVKVNATKALADLALVATAAKALGALTPTITPKVNIAGALASMASLGAAAQGASGAGGMSSLIAVGISLAPILVPAIAAVVAALGAIGPAAVAGALGIGVLALGFSGVFGAIQKISAAQKQASTGTAQYAARQSGVASAIRGVASAQRSLANAEANAAEQRRQSTEKIRAAEQNLTSAQAAARVAQEGLTAARKEAIQAAEDLEASVKGGALAQRAALLDVTEAQNTLDDVLTNPQSTNLERQRAQLNYDQAVQNLDDLKVRNQRLQDQQADGVKKGINGSDQVVAARKKIADADTEAAAARKAVDDARHDADVQARQSAFALAQAQDGVISAQDALKNSYTSAGVAGVKAADVAADAFRGHSPEFKEFVQFVLGVKGAFTQVRNAAEAGLLPGVEDGIKALLPVLPVIATVVGQVATAMGDLFRRAGQALGAPFWVTFFTTLGKFAGPALETFGDIMGGVTRGFGSLIEAFIPFSQSFGDGLAGMAESFATWAASLTKSQGFKDFIAYASENGPVLVKLLGDIVLTAIKLGIVFAPLGEIMLKGLGVLFDFLANADPTVLAVIAAAIGAVILAVAGAATPISLIITAIVLLVGAIVYAYNRFPIFRAIVLATFDAIKIAALFLWENVLRPTFNFIVAAAIVVGNAFLDFYRNYVQPAFSAVGSVISTIYHNFVQPIFSALVFFIRNIIAPTFLFLYRNAVLPAMTAIRVIIAVAWGIIKVIFGLLQIALKVVGATFMILYRLFVKPAIDLVVAIVRTAWETFLRPTFVLLGDIIEKYVAPGFKRGVDAVSKAWAKIREVAKIPIKFVIDTVLNNGLLAAYNKVAKLFNVKPDNVQIPLPAGFATGGYVAGMGGPTSDSILARLSNGEYVIPAGVVKAFGVGFFDFLLGKAPKAGQAVRPGDGSEGLAFARGGPVPGYAEGGFVGQLTGLWNKLPDPLDWIKGKVASLVGEIPGAGNLVAALKSFGTRSIGWAMNFLREKITNRGAGNGGYYGPVSSDVADVQKFITAQAGKPYIWTGVGPAGYDCSGAVGAVYNLLHGRSPHSRPFSTSNEGSFFPKPGHGLFTAGWAHPGQRGASAAVGHTAGNLAGLGFESRGSVGFIVGNRANSVDSFANVGTYDSGGWLMPGLTVAYNGTGERERILTGSQWSGVEKAMAGGGRGGGRSVTYQVTPRYATVDESALRSIVAEQDLRERHGRPD